VRTSRDAGLAAVDRMPLAKRRMVAAAAGLSGDTPALLQGALP
jgi:hypothetical protein